MAPNTAHWEIVSAPWGRSIKNRGDWIGTITKVGGAWLVHINNHPELDFAYPNLDVCVGYVRGVERMRVLETNF